MNDKRIAIIGARGGIGSAFVDHYAKISSNIVYAFSRQGLNIKYKNVVERPIELLNEDSISEAALSTEETGPLDLVVVATGRLHDDKIKPEKSLRDLNYEDMSSIFETNTIAPMLAAKYFLPKLKKDTRTVFAALSARVGSISDNGLGGWYSYRASKTALNMFIKTLSIESYRTRKKSIVVGLHPGTVDTNLSKPFQARVPQHKLFSPEQAATQLANVIASLSCDDSGNVLAWDGTTIPP